MKKSLYNIKEDYLILMNQIEDAEGILTPEMEQALTINEKDRDVKSVAYLEVIKNRESFNLVIDEEIKRLQAYKKRNTTLTTQLKNNLVEAVNLFGEFVVGTVTFCTQKSTIVVIDDEDAIDKKFKVSKVTTSIDKKTLKEALKTEEIEGAHLQTNFNFRIK